MAARVPDVACVVLVVGVGVDDDVGAAFEAVAYAGRKSHRKAAVDGKSHDLGAGRASDLGGAVVRAVIHHQHLDPVKTVHLARQRGDGLGKVLPPRSTQGSG